MVTQVISNQNSVTACTISGTQVEVELVVNRNGHQLQMYARSPSTETGRMIDGPAISVSQEDTSVTLTGAPGTNLSSIVISSNPSTDFTDLYHLVQNNGGSLEESLIINASSA